MVHNVKKGYSASECENVYRMFVAHNGSFGRRTLKSELAKLGHNYSERKISGILKQLLCTAKYGRRKGKNVYTSSNTKKYLHDNLYRQLSEEDKAKEIWSMDFTEEKVDGKKIYTCGIISVNRKIVVGYSQGKKCTTELAKKALDKAISEYGKPYMIMTDRGSQFTSEAFYVMMNEKGIIHSMSRPHTPVDNRFIETFWKSMKVEMGKTNLLNSETYSMVVDYYIYYYNNLRPHSTLGYRAPLEVFPRYLGNTSSTNEYVI
jgi:transposase InsO family protein